jgi:hypothetical protein
MPRIYTSASEPIDYCRGCMPSVSTAQRRHGHDGDGPDDRGNCFGYDAEHPDYSDEDYQCHACGKPLTVIDN